MPQTGQKQSKTDDIESDVDYVAKLDKKLAYALDHPQPIFDLSDCNLDEVPPNIFSAIKISKKHVLNLQNNRLQSLSGGGLLDDLKYLKVLDLSYNKFVKLPNSLDKLKNLEVFDISKNALIDIPASLGNLQHLIWLNLSNNDLRALPDSIGNLKKLEVINLRLNPQLKYLPSTMGKLSSLEQIDIDPTVLYPPRDVHKQGVPALLAFLLNDLQDDFPSTSKKGKHFKGSAISWTMAEDQVKHFEKLKEEKQKQLVDLEKQLASTHQQEIELQQHLKEKRQKLIEDIQKQQKAVEDELLKMQERKNLERIELLKTCEAEEKKACEIISKIVNLNKKRQAHVLEMWEQDKLQEEARLFSTATQSKTLERKKILVSMNEMIKSEIDYLTKTVSSKKIITLHTIANQVAQVDEDLQKALKRNESSQKHLIDTIRTHEELQKSAVAALLEKSDAASWGLTQEIFLVQQQLSELTRIEVTKRKAESEMNIEEINKSRAALTSILTQMFQQKQERRKHLLDTMRKMELIKESQKNTDSYWMEQYDKLLTSKSHEMVKFLQSLHPELIKEFFYNGVLHFLPLLKNAALSTEKLKSLDNNSLLRIGIKLPEERLAVLTAVENFLIYLEEEEEETPADAEKSELEVVLSKTIFMPSMECVVCLNAKPTMLFVSCGHVCCCYKCSLSLSTCPLCRKSIEKMWDIEEGD